MASIRPIEPGWLARTFVEYELLPNLLALPDTRDTDNAPESWLAFLSGKGCNLEHMLDEDLPADDDIPLYLVADAWHLVRQLELVEKYGLTPAGQSIANIFNPPLVVRYSGGLTEDLNNMLAQQVTTCYWGKNRLNVTRLLQRGAALLAGTKHVWAAYCPGLLLVEFEALVHLAGTDSDRALQLCDELLSNRDYAMHAYDMPSPDVPPLENMIRHADAVTEFYLDDLQLLPDATPDIGTARATAILYSFAMLLKEVYPIGPVQCLAPTGNLFVDAYYYSNHLTG